MQEVDMADLNDLKEAADKAKELAKKAGITEADIDKAKDKAIDMAKDFVEKKTGK